MKTDHTVLSNRLDELLERSDDAFARARLLLGRNSMAESDYTTLYDDLLRVQREADDLIVQLRSRLNGNRHDIRGPYSSAR